MASAGPQEVLTINQLIFIKEVKLLIMEIDENLRAWWAVKATAANYIMNIIIHPTADCENPKVHVAPTQTQQ